MDLNAIVVPLVSHGPIGILALVAIYSAWSKDKQLAEVNEARIKESREATAQILAVSDRVNTATNQLAATADKLVELKQGERR